MQFRDKYYFLSNMYPTLLNMKLGQNKYTFNNAEAAFQAQKNLSLADQFQALNGFEAKRLGRTVPLTTPNWNSDGRLKAMANALYTKFQNEDLLAQLQNVSGDIVEDNTWGDTYWGVSNGVGQNVLGQMLMNIRDNNNDIDSLRNFVTAYKLK